MFFQQEDNFSLIFLLSAWQKAQILHNYNHWMQVLLLVMLTSIWENWSFLPWLNITSRFCVNDILKVGFFSFSASGRLGSLTTWPGPYVHRRKTTIAQHNMSKIKQIHSVLEVSNPSKVLIVVAIYGFIFLLGLKKIAKILAVLLKKELQFLLNSKFYNSLWTHLFSCLNSISLCQQSHWNQSYWVHPYWVCKMLK